VDTSYDVMAPIHASSAERDAALARLRRHDPVHWDAANQWWLLTRHADIREALSSVTAAGRRAGA
jgi:hypothetical protein